MRVTVTLEESPVGLIGDTTQGDNMNNIETLGQELRLLYGTALETDATCLERLTARVAKLVLNEMEQKPTWFKRVSGALGGNALDNYVAGLILRVYDNRTI